MAQALNRVLIAVTSANLKFWPLGLKNWVFLDLFNSRTEVLHPYETFQNHGYEIDLVSETGTTGIDESSSIYAQIDGESRRALNDKTHPLHELLGAKLNKPENIDPKKYAIIFYAGGHGAVFDFPTASGLQHIGASIYQNGGVIASVCHGPAIFANLKVNNDLVIKGKKVTAFTTSGEKLMMATDRLKEHNVPLMEDLLRGLGADWQEPPNINPMSEFVVVDGRLVSGVNPASASLVAQKAVEIVKGGQVDDKQPKKSIF